MAGKTKAKTLVESAEEVTEVNAPSTEAAEQPKQEAPKKASFFVYIGPSILGVIQTASIYKPEEVDKMLGAAIAKYPRIRNLLVSDETIAADRINVTTPGTRLYAEYRKMVNDLKK